MSEMRERVIGFVAGVAGAIVGIFPAFAAEPEAGLGFMRVHVPRDAVADVPMRDERYVPMPRDDFEAAVERAAGKSWSASSPRATRVTAARYEAGIDESGRLGGRVAFDVVAPGDRAVADPLPLGGLGVARCTARTAAGVGAAVVFGRADGTLAVAVAGTGEYVADWTAPSPRPTTDGPLYTLPLVPAARTSIRLRLPSGRRPLLVGNDLPPERVDEEWLIEVVPRPTLEFYVVDDEPPPPAMSVWSRIGIAGREVSIHSSGRPIAVWTGSRVVFDKDPELIVTGATLGGRAPRAVSWSEADDGRSITLVLPAVALGTRAAVEIRAVGPLPDGPVRPLPALRPRREQWSGGGAVLEVDAPLALATIDASRCVAVTAEAAAAWPLPGVDRETAADTGAARVIPARVYLEQQDPTADVRVRVVPRSPRFEVARATVVDFAPGVVVGVATCDVSIQRGEAFEMAGLIAPGWFIDTVDAVGWSTAPAWLDPTAVPDIGTPETLEWKVVRDARGDVLRIGLSAAATPGRRLRLRIGGHRAGAAAGTSFTAAEIDMVRLAGEADGMATIGFKTNAEQSVEIVGGESGAVDPRLASLVDDPTVRSWTPAGGRSAAWQVRRVRRRPPLDVQAQVRLTVRDDRLSQSFTFECRPDASDLDSLVVRFTELIDDQLEWSLLAPAGGSMAARRLESSDESWVVEFTPPVREAVTIRAARTIPFQEPVPIPLAWVEGAPHQVGELLVRDAGRLRPRILNRRLAELPPRAGAAEEWPVPIGEFSFTGVVDASAPLPAAELLPGRRDDGADRGWAWRETESCWVHASGRTEFESAFDVENHGRETVILGLPAGRHLQGVEIDGTPVAVVAPDDAASIPVDLPAGRASFRLVVRSVGETAAWGGWRIEPAGVVIDLPVLERLCRIAVPPEIDIASVPATWRGVGSTSAEGFRIREFVPADGVGAAVIVVHRRWILTAAVLVAFAVLAAALDGGRHRPWLPAACCVVSGVAALWCPSPGDLVASAAWWAAVAAAIVTVRRHVIAARALTLATLCCAVVPCAAADFEVFIVPVEQGEMALVPEPLYRALARRQEGDERIVRVVSCHLRIPESSPGPGGEERWRMALEIDAAAAGTLALGPQEDPAGWLPDTVRIDGRSVPLTVGRGTHDLLVPSAGRHRVEIDVRPRAESQGAVEMLGIAIPPAPLARVAVVERDGHEAAGAVGLRCEKAAPGGPFVEAPRGELEPLERLVFDVSRAERVRIVRPRAPGATLAVRRPSVESRNTVSWELDACQVHATFVIDPGRDIAAPCVVRADRGLVVVGPTDPAVDVAPLAGNRFLVRSARPAAGPLRFELVFRRPLSDPVGVFPLPGAWIEDAEVDMRTIRLVPAGDLSVQVEAPPPLVPLTGNDGVGQPGGPAWRLEVRAPEEPTADDHGGLGASAPFSAEPRPRITVERRRQEIRGTQDVRVWFASERTRIALDARFDASSTALVMLPLELPPDCIVDSIVLSDDGLHLPDAAAPGPIETHWQRTTPDRGVLTLQRPQAGRFRLDVAAHVPRPPATTGRVPVVRALMAAAPAVVAWNESLSGQAQDRSWQLRSDERAPLFALRPAVVAPPTDTTAVQPTPPGEKAGADEPRVELAEVEVTLQDRGRAWGRARFDLVTNDRVVRLKLPEGMRLFDVFVDGQPTVPAAPAGIDAAATGGRGERWDITLHDVGWPRSIEIVYAGALGGALEADGPLVLSPPAVLGLPCVRRLWTVRPPRDSVVRIADAASVLDPSALRQERAAAFGGLSADFERAIAAALPPERERLRAAFDARGRGLDEEHAAATKPDAAGAVVHLVARPVDASLTVRVVRRRDPSVAARAWATIALLAVGGAIWTMARRRGAP